MIRQYLIAIGGDHPPGEAERLAALTGLQPVYAHPGILAFASAACGRYALGDRGMVLGTLFWRHGPARTIDRLTDGEVDRILADPVCCLLSRCWGGYVCATANGAGIVVLRDPSGTLPCYHADVAGAKLVASDVGLLLAAGCPRPGIDWLAVGRHHFSCGLPTPDTALDNVKELMPGCSMTLTGKGGGDQRMCWSPWDHVQPDPAARGERAEEKFRRVVTHCARAWASPHPRLIASVSGGLDSSILAASLARSDREVRCITMWTDDPAGDERHYAQALCEHLDLPLVANRCLVDEVDISEPVSPHLPRPIGYAFGQPFEQAHLSLARELGAGAFVTGAGGDNVFGYSQSAAAIVDRWACEGSVAALRTLRDVCDQTGCGFIVALRGAMRIGRRAGYRWRATPEFLHADLCAAFTPADLQHPWLIAPRGSLPGKAAHIASLLRMQHLLEPPRSRFAPVLYPLLSQPVVECCLAIPSWEWRTGGMDRAVARRSFAAQLPDLIVRRRVKGAPDGFAASVMRRNRAAMCDRLVHGELARHGVVDREAIIARLAGDVSLSPFDMVRVFDLLDTEAWVRSWMLRLARPNAEDASAWRFAAPPSG